TPRHLRAGDRQRRVDQGGREGFDPGVSEKGDRPIVALVRDAVDADRKAIVWMFARAFHEDPAAVWLRPDSADRAAQMSVGYRWLFDEGAGGMRLVTPEREAASLWKFSTQLERSAQAWAFADMPFPTASETPEDRMRLMM